MRVMLIAIQFFVGLLCQNALASPGDNLDEFIDCTFACEYQRSCPHSEIHWIDPATNAFAHEKFKKTPLLLSQLLFWDCIADCDYQCQQIVTDVRQSNGEEIYQFHGKWPFKRIFGFQEFFSTIFSIGNFIPHYLGYHKLQLVIAKRRMGQESTIHILQNYVYVSVAGMLAWAASTIFHWRDLIVTEKLDYFFAGLTVLTAFHAILVRICRLDRYPYWRVCFKWCVISVFVLHILRLYLDWSYTYNMRFNVFFGLCQYILLIAMAYRNYTKLQQTTSRTVGYKRQDEFKLCVVPVGMVLFTAMAMSLELFDFFSIAWQIDSHALWHFCTIWPSLCMYDFFLDDYNYFVQPHKNPLI